MLKKLIIGFTPYKILVRNVSYVKIGFTFVEFDLFGRR